MKVVYKEEGQDQIVLAEITANRSMTVWEALEVAGVDMDECAEENGWDGWDPEAIQQEG